LFKKPGAALPIDKGIASVDSLEGGLGNMRAETGWQRIKFKVPVLIKRSNLSGLMP